MFWALVVVDWGVGAGVNSWVEGLGFSLLIVRVLLLVCAAAVGLCLGVCC